MFPLSPSRENEGVFSSCHDVDNRAELGDPRAALIQLSVMLSIALYQHYSFSYLISLESHELLFLYFTDERPEHKFYVGCTAE